MSAVVGLSFPSVCVLQVDGPLLRPLHLALRHSVRALLSRGERTIVLDLSRVSRIDAAGVGELVRAHNMAVAVDGSVRIVHASPWVRRVLERVGLFDLLSAERHPLPVVRPRQHDGRNE